MGQELNLLKSLPQTKRNVNERAAAKSAYQIGVARLFGEKYFDGPREFGYGGYTYDGRWRPVAQDIVHQYNLGRNARVLDIGCAKGFLVKDLLECGVDAYGQDVSYYALSNCEAEVIGRLHKGSGNDLTIFPDKSFDLVLSINTLHNLPRPLLVSALKEITRVSKGPAFIVVDSYHTPEEKALFEQWVLTAMWHGYPDEWLQLFAEAGYQGDYAWTIV